jgi:hypothetical protein
MHPDELSVLEKLQYAYDFVAEALGQAPQLHDCHLDQALLVIVLAMKRARRSPRLRPPPRWPPCRISQRHQRQPELPF